MKFDLEKFVKEQIVIHCSTREQASKLYNILESKCKLSESNDIVIMEWYKYKEKTCFRIIKCAECYYMEFSNSDTYNGFKIVKFSDLIFDKGVSNMKTLEQFAKDNELSGLVVKYSNVWKGLIVTLGGKNYILRDGVKFKLVIIELGDEQKLYRPKVNTGLLEDILNDNNLELVWEKQEVDWSKVPIDTKVLCRAGDFWLKRYFAGVNNEGEPLIFFDGRDSWTEQGSQLSPENIVLFEGNEHLLEDNKC